MGSIEKTWMRELRPKVAQEIRPEVAREIRPEVAREVEPEVTRRILQRQMQRRFGDLSAEDQTRIQSATMPELDAWTDSVLDAGSVQAVFRGGADE